MPLPGPNPAASPPGSPLLGFLFITVIAVAFLGVSVVLGTEPRMRLDRSADGSFRVTGSNHFAGHQFFTRTIAGVTGVRVDDAVRDGRRDPERVNRKRRRVLHLEFTGADRSSLGWDRESDAPAIEAFMRGHDPSFTLANPPPTWRMALAWSFVGLAALTFLGALKNLIQGKSIPITADTAADSLET